MKLHGDGVVEKYIEHHFLDPFLFAIVLGELVEISSYSFGSPICNNDGNNIHLIDTDRQNEIKTERLIRKKTREILIFRKE